LVLHVGARDTRRDVVKLRIPIGMLPPFCRLEIALEAVAERVEQLGHYRMTDVMAQRLERKRQRPCALATPAERRVGIARRRRLDQGVEIVQERGVDRRQGLAAAAGPTNPRRRYRRGARVEFPLAPLNG
jgi:hypothetical protein